MKNFKLFLMAAMSLLLPSCANTPPSSENIVNEETERLNAYIPETPTPNNTVRLPAGGTFVSGEKSGEKLIKTPEILNPEIPLKEIELPNETTPKTPKKPPKEAAKSNVKKPLGTYTSKVYTKTADRQKNLKIVCNRLSGTIVAPNQEFSYNATCGPYNKENGFGKATIFLGDGTEKQDYGGGVCQLSSTLYNAVKNLNIEVTERHNHSKKVYYVPDGQDATVSYGALDFKFKNLNDYPLLIKASSSANSVVVNVYKA